MKEIKQIRNLAGVICAMGLIVTAIGVVTFSNLMMLGIGIWFGSFIIAAFAEILNKK